MSVPSFSEISGLITSIAASAKIGTCLLVTTSLYFLTKKFGLIEWQALPAWTDAVAMLLLLWSAASVLWEAVPLVWKKTTRSIRRSASEREARRLTREEKYILLFIAESPDNFLNVHRIDLAPIDATDVVLHQSIHSLLRKGLIVSTRNFHGLAIKLSVRGLERISPIQKSVLEGNLNLWDD